MKPSIHIKNFSELTLFGTIADDIRRKIDCITLDSRNILSEFSSATYLDGFTAILVLSGKGNITINYKDHPIQTDTMLLLSSSHLFRFQDCSADLRCICLFVSKEFMDETDSTDMIFQRIKYGVKLYNTPVIRLSSQHAAGVYQRIIILKDRIKNREHYYYKEVILNSLFGFYLDLSDSIERYMASSPQGYANRYESIIHSFIELLATHYRQEHKVDFYASQLHISDHYLTQIVKSVTGQSVSDFIFEMLYSEARTLLQHSKLSIKEVAALLNFSDQSAFGKFFKRKAGVSPYIFRKIIHQKEA
ncbi:MAG: AraC family transcriptional regulator [Bacteroides sp.]|nr:AraC family transcriptional regulator [Bacteroides sp.]